MTLHLHSLGAPFHAVAPRSLACLWNRWAWQGVWWGGRHGAGQTGSALARCVVRSAGSQVQGNEGGEGEAVSPVVGHGAEQSVGGDVQGGQRGEGAGRAPLARQAGLDFVVWGQGRTAAGGQQPRGGGRLQVWQGRWPPRERCRRGCRVVARALRPALPPRPPARFRYLSRSNLLLPPQVVVGSAPAIWLPACGSGMRVAA